MGKKAEALFLDPEEMLSGENFMTELLEFLKVSFTRLLTPTL
jgi:hypothetical protein